MIVEICDIENKFNGIKFDEDCDFDEYLIEEKSNGKLEARRGLCNYSEDECIIGKSVKEMEDFQTLNEFKKSVLEELKKIGWKNDDVGEIDLFIDAGYDG